MNSNKKNIYQLAKLSRRIVYLRRRCLQILTRNRKGGETLTDGQVNHLRARMSGTLVVESGLKSMLREHSVGEKPFRDARPLKQQRHYTPPPASLDDSIPLPSGMILSTAPAA